nr:EOG090X09DI [Leptodora kindtii]
MSASTWKRPEDVMRQVREKKRALQTRFGQSTALAANNVEGNIPPARSSPLETAACSVKRKNPFRRSPAKKVKLSTSDQEDEPFTFVAANENNDETIFKLLNGFLKPTVPDTKIETAPVSLLFNPLASESQGEQQGSICVDWSLKTRVRFTSRKPYAFSSTLKTSEEASGVTAFVRCVNPSSSETLSSLDTSTNAQLHQCCLYWQHPWLPWLQMFPRDTPSPVTSSTSSLNIGMDPKISATLHNDWCESFRTLFGLLRARQCPFFYVCTHQFNVLFRASGIGDIAETHALMTPTTKGLRDILSKEDIAFSMPLRSSSQSDVSKSDQLPTSRKDVDDLDSDAEDNDGGDSEEEWINDIGLHSNLRSKLEAERLQDGGQGTIQGSYSDSLLLIEGVETQGLFNWLMASKLCMSNTGPLAGIPPTLLSPVAFHGATLRPLKVRQGLLKTDGESLYSIELQGPVMPHSVISLMNLLESQDYSAIFTVLASTKPFSAFGSQSNKARGNGTTAFSKESLSDCGLDQPSLALFCASQSMPSFTEIKYHNGSFFYK